MFKEKKAAIITYLVVAAFILLVPFVFFGKYFPYAQKNLGFMIPWVVLVIAFAALAIRSIATIENPATSNGFHWLVFFVGVAAVVLSLFILSDIRARKSENIKGEFSYRL